MLFKRPILQGIAAGEVTLAFRRWQRASVQVGTRLRTEVGVVVIEAIESIRESDITEANACKAGFATKTELLADLRSDPKATLYRIRLSFGGADPRIALREDDDLTAAEIAAIETRLARFDAASKIGPWTAKVLSVIQKNPERAVGELAAVLKFEKEWLKVNIRKLKELGLTESLQPGYRLSPRGKVFLKRREKV